MKKVFKRFMKKSVGIMIVMLMLITTFMSPITVFATARTDLRALNYNADGENSDISMHMASTGLLTWGLKTGYTKNTVNIYEYGQVQVPGPASSGELGTVTSYGVISAMDAQMYETGKYTVEVEQGSNNSYKDRISFNYVSPYDKLESPTGLAWNENTISWNSVTNATKYTVDIYNADGERVGIAISTTASYDLSSYPLTAGDGWYFTVQAKSTSTSPKYRDSNISESPLKGTGERTDLRALNYSADGENSDISMHMASTGLLTWGLKTGYTKNTVNIYEYGQVQVPGPASSGELGTVTSYGVISAMDAQMYETGKYTVEVEQGSNNSYKDRISFNYVSPYDKLESPTGLAWNENTISWNSVTNATKYTVDIYNADGERVGIAISTTASYDLSSYPLTAGDGWYFTVQAKSTSTSPKYRDSNISESPLKDTGATSTTHQVTFNLDGGTMTGTNPVTVDDGEKVTRPTTNPTKSGYIFAGWYADAGLTQEFNFNTITITADTTIYARWDEIIDVATVIVTEPVVGETPSYNVTVGDSSKYWIDDSYITWNKIYPTSGSVDSFEAGSKYDFRVLFRTKFGYAFSEDTIFLINGHKTGQWGDSNAMANYYFSTVDNDSNINVYFHMEDGETPTASITIPKGSTVPKPDDPIRNGYTFIRWETAQGYIFDFNEPKFSNPTELYATWVENENLQTYTITLNPNNGTAETNSITNIANQSIINLGTPESYGFTVPQDKEFYGWKIGNEIYLPGEYLEITSNLTAVAQYIGSTSPQVTTHTVTFNLDGGTMTGTNPVTVDDGAKVTRPTTDPTKDGNAFEGWYADAGLNNEFDFDNTAITADTTIYAKWRDHSSVAIGTTTGGKYSSNELHAENETSSMNATLPVNGSITLTATADAGYHFVGWYEGVIGSSYFVEDHTTTLISSNATYTTTVTDTLVIRAVFEADTPSADLTITGDNQTFTLGDSNNITITCSGALNDLTAIKVNGVELEEANRELESGSTVLTLKNSYLNTLSVGTYTVTFEYGANSKDATLNVVEATNNNDDNNNNNDNTNTNDNTNDNTNTNTNNSNSNNPQTSYNVVDYVYTLIIGIICLAGGTVYLKRKKLFGNR